LTPTNATVIAHYHHPVWGKYAAVTRNAYGKGEVTYVGFMPSDVLIEKILEDAVKRAGLWGPQQSTHFPAIVRSGVLSNGHPVHYFLNYSADPARITYAFHEGAGLLSGTRVAQGGNLSLPAWGVAVVEESVRQGVRN
jgi:beta-galactosidase